MARRALSVVLLSLSCLFAPPAVLADPVRITSGQLVVTGIHQLGSLDIVGTQDFSLRAVVDNASDGFWQCVDPECVPGTPISLFINLGGPTMINAVATLNGVTYPDVDQLTSPAFTFLNFRGFTTAPANTGEPAIVMAPFDFDGGFYLEGTGLLRALTGIGVATVSLTPYSLPDDPGNWRVERIQYDFSSPAPVPEPATLTLTATALAGAWTARRRARGRPVEED